MDERPDNQINGVELNEAATIMDTTAEALRKRIQRGSLQGYKVDGRWYVVLPNEYKRPDGDRTDENDTYDDRHDNKGDRPDTVRTYEAHIASLQEEIEFLRKQVATLTQDGLEKNRTINGLAQRLTELPEISQTMQEQESLKHELLDTMHQEIAATERRLDERQTERDLKLEERDRVLMETLRTLQSRADEHQKKKPWWRRGR